MVTPGCDRRHMPTARVKGSAIKAQGRKQRLERGRVHAETACRAGQILEFVERLEQAHLGGSILFRVSQIPAMARAPPF